MTRITYRNLVDPFICFSVGSGKKLEQVGGERGGDVFQCAVTQEMERFRYVFGCAGDPSLF